MQLSARGVLNGARQRNSNSKEVTISLPIKNRVFAVFASVPLGALVADLHNFFVVIFRVISKGTGWVIRLTGLQWLCVMKLLALAACWGSSLSSSSQYTERSKSCGALDQAVALGQAAVLDL